MPPVWEEKEKREDQILTLTINEGGAPVPHNAAIFRSIVVMIYKKHRRKKTATNQERRSNKVLEGTKS